MQKNHQILFIYSQNQTFIKSDYDLLSKTYQINKFQFNLNKGIIGFVKTQFLGLMGLFKHTKQHDLIYIWFCDYHTFWAVMVSKLFNKKSIIIVGGYDAVALPKYNYGLFVGNTIRKKMAVWAYSNCDKIIAVDKALLYGYNDYAPSNKTGLINWVNKKEIVSKGIVIPTGYSPNKWQIQTKENQVLTVAQIKNKRVFDIKGINLFLQVAKEMPTVKFILVGLQDKTIIPPEFEGLPNLIVYPIVSQNMLIDLYAKSKVYCQFSITEGLPNVLCEAMMSGCIPVGSAVNGIPTAIGDTGYIINKPDVALAKQAVKNALNEPPAQAKKVRQRIIDNYSLGKRDTLLNQELNQLLFSK